MFNSFKNLTEVILHFSTDKVCREFLETKRWNGTPTCPHCSCDKWYKLNDGKTYKCGNKECYKKYTVTVGTIYENTNVPLTKWFAAVYIITAHKKGISSIQLSKDIGVTQKTAWYMNHRIRQMVGERHPEALENTVEVDETYVGGKMKNKHTKVRAEAHANNVSHTDNKTGVMGFLERGSGVRLNVIDKTKSFKEMVKGNVALEAIVITDSLNAYTGLANEFKGHEVVNHSEDEYVRGEWHTNTIEGFFSFLKRSIYGCYHYVSPKHLQRYCNENSYRYNTRDLKDGQRFEITLSNIEGRLPYKTLIGK